MIECIARLAGLSYFRTYLPHLTAISLPLTFMTKSPYFHWGIAQEHTWNNLRMLIAFQLEISLQDPQYPLLLTSDASQIQLAFPLSQVVESFQLKLIYTDTKILPPIKA